MNRLSATLVGLVISATVSTIACASDTADTVLTAAQREQIDRLERFAENSAHSPDLRLRILFSLGGVDEHADGTLWSHEVIPVDVLVDAARGSTDPLVLDLLLHRCADNRLHPGCDKIDLARRWVAADTQNQLAWLALADELRTHGDLDAARATFVRAAQASLWHEHYNDVGRLMARAVPQDVAPTERMLGLMVVFSKVMFTSPPYQALYGWCKESSQSDAMRDACARISATMFRDADTVMSLALTAPLAARAAVNRTTLAAYQQKHDALQWALAQIPGHAENFDDLDESAQRDVVEQLTALLENGERRSAERLMLERRVSESEAARLRVATMGNAELKRREDRLAGR